MPPLVLAYHGIADVKLRDDPHSLFVGPARLRSHVALVRRWGYRFTTFSDLAAANQAGDARGLCALTFDDGFADNLQHLAPLLAEAALPATVFVVSSMLGVPHPDAPAARTMTAEEVRQLAACGVEIGSHAATHTDLTTLARCDVEANLRRSREELAEVLGGMPPVALAYPFGHADATTRDAAAAVGFSFACRTGDAGTWADPLDLPRAAMNSTSTTLGLVLKREGVYERVLRLRPARLARSAKRRLLVRLR